MIVNLEPYFKTLTNYYWDHKDPDKDGSIWFWLEQDFKAHRMLHSPLTDDSHAGRMYDLHFDDEKDAMFFILRWA